jgi:hypothetical protein
MIMALVDYFCIETADGMELWLEEMPYSEACKVYEALKMAGRKIVAFQTVTRKPIYPKTHKRVSGAAS